jgi:Fic family protein
MSYYLDQEKQLIDCVDRLKSLDNNYNDRRDRLINDFVELILDAQENGFTIPEIVDITGVSKPTLYKYIQKVKGVRRPDKAYNKK